MIVSELIEMLNGVLERNGDLEVYWSPNPRGTSTKITACDVYMGGWSRGVDPPHLVPRVWLSFGDVIGGIKADQQRQRDSAVSASSALLGGAQKADAEHSASEASGVDSKNAGANNCVEKNNSQP